MRTHAAINFTNPDNLVASSTGLAGGLRCIRFAFAASAGLPDPHTFDPGCFMAVILGKLAARFAGGFIDPGFGYSPSKMAHTSSWARIAQVVQDIAGRI